ncbi:MAG: hypothetical protein ACE5F5_08875 [Acidimicrobiia bacterium]
MVSQRDSELPAVVATLVVAVVVVVVAAIDTPGPSGWVETADPALGARGCG